MKRNHYYQEADELFESIAEQVWSASLDVVVRLLADIMRVDNPSLELVEELVLDCFLWGVEKASPQVGEFFADEAIDRYLVEERQRLALEYAEGVPEDVLVKAVMKRAHEDYPEAFFP